jgi:hypothetical protein
VIAASDLNRKVINIFADLPTATVRRLLGEGHGLRPVGFDQATTTRRSRDTSTSTRTTRDGADARTTDHVESHTSVREVTPPPFRDNRTVVEVAPTTQTSQTSSYVENQKTLERSLLPMADHGHGGGGGAKAPEWLGKAVAILVVVGLGFVLFIGIANFLHHGSFGGEPSASRTTLVDDWRTRDDDVVVRRRTTGTASPRTIVRDDRRLVTAGTGARSLPSPEEVARSVPHRRERIPVDCVPTHWRAENSNRCVSIQWVPGDD